MMRMDLRTSIKLHLENLNKRVLELHESKFIEDREELKRIRIEADGMLPALKYVDEELYTGALCIGCNVGAIESYINNALCEEGIVPVCKPGKNEEGKLVALATDIKIEDLPDAVLAYIHTFRLF